MGKIDDLYRRVVHELVANSELGVIFVENSGFKRKERLDCAGAYY